MHACLGRYTWIYTYIVCICTHHSFYALAYAGYMHTHTEKHTCMHSEPETAVPYISTYVHVCIHSWIPSIVLSKRLQSWAGPKQPSKQSCDRICVCVCVCMYVIRPPKSLQTPLYFECLCIHVNVYVCVCVYIYKGSQLNYQSRERERERERESTHTYSH
jgi:hypothetical protein